MKLPTISLFEPDKHRLDDELQLQPKMTRVWLARLAKAERVLDKAKARLKFVEADLDRRIRSHPSTYGFEKTPSEPAIRHAINLQRKYRDAQEDVIEAQYAVNQLTGIKISLDHRKKSVEGLIYLHGQEYWAEPRVKAEDRNRVGNQKIDRVFKQRRK